MTRRFVCIWLSRWPTDRWQRRNSPGGTHPGPLALVLPGQGGIRLHAVNALASADGLSVGMLLADARALCPAVTAPPADPAGDRAELGRLALWAQRYTPQAASDGADGLVLDITGCAHLWSGEVGLLADLSRRLRRAGLTHRLALADSPAAAWGWARHRPAGAGEILPTGRAAWEALLALPLAALRLDAALTADLARVGLQRVADLHRLPRAPLTARYGTAPARRLDRLLGLGAEPLAPQARPPQWQARLPLAEPIFTRDAIDTGLDRLLRDLCGQLEASGRGARRLELLLVRSDASQQTLALGTGQPLRDISTLKRLFREKLDQAEPGFGIEMMLLTATLTDRFTASQTALGSGDAFALTFLLDRLCNRLGPDRIGPPLAEDEHQPERAVGFAGGGMGGQNLTGPAAEISKGVTPISTVTPAQAGVQGPQALCSTNLDPGLRRGDGGVCEVGNEGRAKGEANTPTPWPKAQPRAHSPRPRTWQVEAPRPLLLLDPPEPVEKPEAAALVWRGRRHGIDWMEGPERIRPDWWRARPGTTRDYFRLQLADGRRLWLFRTAEEVPRWFLHGLFP
ncbi:DNA polymerase Y family protein [Niveispirillum sp. BGYR6]|uniref:Y-family DNA polymerase n=1 Tax=Niveispirillum sp. BGYR6 TaxID=2971249 RepID=UPI0022B99876|nr:DNA polymerase Y family protein [Niveispirillum sp. BGYR6]MDG5497584.1 DNA polymerase Y family protein [Niveispirillum sp. BGYR6]